jgi:hypothetical protein
MSPLPGTGNHSHKCVGSRKSSLSALWRGDVGRSSTEVSQFFAMTFTRHETSSWTAGSVSSATRHATATCARADSVDGPERQARSLVEACGRLRGQCDAVAVADCGEPFVGLGRDRADAYRRSFRSGDVGAAEPVLAPGAGACRCRDECFVAQVGGDPAAFGEVVAGGQYDGAGFAEQFPDMQACCVRHRQSQDCRLHQAVGQSRARVGAVRLPHADLPAGAAAGELGGDLRGGSFAAAARKPTCSVFSDVLAAAWVLRIAISHSLSRVGTRAASVHPAEVRVIPVRERVNSFTSSCVSSCAHIHANRL